MFKNFRQDMHITDAKLEAAHAQRAAEKAQGKLERTDERLSHLAMITEALWKLLQAKTGWTDEMLLDEIRKLDTADGVEDGRRTPRAVKCHACQRNLPAPGRICIYCGAQPPLTTPFSVLW